jgi:hypothetical protein
MVFARVSVAAIVLALVCGACSGPSQSQPNTEGEDGPESPVRTAEETEARAAVADYETFDPSGYPVEGADRTVEVAHQVPTRLMSGRADEGVRQTIEGFRVQVFSAQDQKAAQDFREEVRRWWEQVQDDAPRAVFRSSPPPIVIEYSQPYYRVRIGAFAEREEAEEALEFVQEEYAGAFIARSTVTVMR